jgi:glucose/arabinose dehydrogenase
MEDIIMPIIKAILSALLLISPSLALSQTNEHQNVLKQLHVPAGFSISIFADNLPNARSLALGDNGVVFVGASPGEKVYAVQDTNNDGIADQRYVISNQLFMPNGVAYKNGSLYVAEINRILRFDNIMQQLNNPSLPVVIYDQLPSSEHHGWKYLRIGPDDKLYTVVSAPCNICEPEKPIYSSLVRLQTDGQGFEVLARGIRSSVGIDWQPGTNALFLTDNGRDYMGDDLPPDELNLWTAPGQHFGFPYCHGGDIPDPEFAADKNCSQYTPPVWKFKAHMAPLGLRFYRGTQFPVQFREQLFVALHGSWNRSIPQGYRVALVTFSQGKPVSEQIFIDGWLTQDYDVLGRPVDILEMPDGSLLISDDKLGLIYKVTYTGAHG